MDVGTEPVELCRFETQQQEQALATLFADPEVSRHLLVSFSPAQGLAGNAPRFRRNFSQVWSQLGFGGLLIRRRGEAHPLGFVALKQQVRDGEPRPGAFEIYFALARSHWGRGIAGRALAAFLDELMLRLRPESVHACLDPERTPAARRVLEKQGFAFEREVELAGYAGPSLARGSVDLELWRVGAAGAGEQMLEQAAYRIGQLAAAAQLDLPQALHELDEALHAGGLAGRLGAATAREIARRGLAAGAQRARYAVYTRALGRSASR
jgi:RimJ/RimL family protein N-acetyltransferase